MDRRRSATLAGLVARRRRGAGGCCARAPAQADRAGSPRRTPGSPRVGIDARCRDAGRGRAVAARRRGSPLGLVVPPARPAARARSARRPRALGRVLLPRLLRPAASPVRPGSACCSRRWPPARSHRRGPRRRRRQRPRCPARRGPAARSRRPSPARAGRPSRPPPATRRPATGAPPAGGAATGPPRRAPSSRPPDTVRVRPGDSLWLIAARRLGPARRRRRRSPPSGRAGTRPTGP